MKKGLTLLLAVVMLFTMAVANVSAASFADTEGMNCETAVDVLSALGIVEGKEEGVYAPEDSLTRAEMATIVLRLMKMESTATGQDIFTDVPSSHWAYANITAAYQLGIVNGTSETTFNPDDAVTYEQAVKMVVAALGYTVQAEALGGYPSGYLSKAAQLDLLAGVKTGGEMTRGNMAILVYNALDVELFTKAIYGDDAYEYVTDESKTLLSYHLKVTKITDTITATPMGQFASASHSRRLLTDEVAVGSTILKKGETNAQNLLGVRSDIYYEKGTDSDIPVILAIVPRSGAEIIDIKAQDIDASRTSSGVLTYTDAEGKEREVGIGSAKLIYNGREVTKDAAYLVPAMGTVRLVSNSGGDCDVVIVEAYKNYIVDTVLVDDHKVYFKPNPYQDMITEITIDLADNSISTEFTDVEGLPIDIVDLAEWDVVSVAQDDDVNPTIRRIRRSYDMVEGTVTEVSEEDVTIGEAVYSVAPSVNPAEISLGQTAAYYLDFTGAVAAVDTSSGVSRTYGWFVNAETSKGLNGKPQIRMFTQDGEWKVFNFAENIKYNGTSGDSDRVMVPAAFETNTWAYDTAPALLKYDAEGKVVPVPQLVAYKLNEEGLITELETAVNKSSLSHTDDDKFGGDFSLDFYQSRKGTGGTSGARVTRGFDGTLPGDATGLVSEYQLEYSGGLVFTRVYANDSTFFFKIPADTADEKSYSVSGAVAGGLRLEAYRNYTGVAYYDVDDSHQCGAMVIRYDMIGSGGGGVSYPGYDTVNPALVTAVSKVLGEDGEVMTALKLINQSGQEITVSIADEDFECLFKVAMTDLTKDTAWYTKQKDPDTGEEKKIYGANPISGSARIEMFLAPEDLEPGDVIQYRLDGQGQLELASVVHRANYSSKLEYSISGGAISETYKDLNYRGGNLLSYATVTKKLEKGLLATVKLGNTKAEYRNEDAARVLPTSGRFIVWDKEKQTATQITAADVVMNDELFAYWRTTSQQMIIVYR